MDLKAFMTLLKAGSGAHLGKYFCPFCPCLNYQRGEKSIFNVCKNRCKDQNRECYCYEIVDNISITKYCSDTVSQRDLDCFVAFPKASAKKQIWQDFAEVLL